MDKKVEQEPKAKSDRSRSALLNESKRSTPPHNTPMEEQSPVAGQHLREVSNGQD